MLLCFSPCLLLCFISLCAVSAQPCMPPTLSPPDGSLFDANLPRFVLLLVFRQNVSLTPPASPWSVAPKPLSNFTSVSLSDWFTSNAAANNAVYLRDQAGVLRAPLAAAVVLDADSNVMPDRFRVLYSPSGATELIVVLQRGALVNVPVNGMGRSDEISFYSAASLARYTTSDSVAHTCAPSATPMPCTTSVPTWSPAPAFTFAAEDRPLTAAKSPLIYAQLCDPFQECAWQLLLELTFFGSGSGTPYEVSLADLDIALPGDPVPYRIASNVTLFVTRTDAIYTSAAQHLEGVQVYEPSIGESAGVHSEPMPGDSAWMQLWDELADWVPATYASLLALASLPGFTTMPSSYSASYPPPVIHIYNTSALHASYRPDPLRSGSNWSVLYASSQGRTCASCAVRSQKCAACDWTRHVMRFGATSTPRHAYLVPASSTNACTSQAFDAGVHVWFTDYNTGNTEETRITNGSANYTAFSTERHMQAHAHGLECPGPWPSQVLLSAPNSDEPWLSAPSSLVGTQCGQWGVTQASFIAQPAFCAASATSCLPPSLHTLPPSLMAPSSSGYIIATGATRARTRVSSSSNAIEFELVPQAWNLSVVLTYALRLHQPLLRIAVSVSAATMQLMIRNEGNGAGLFNVSQAFCALPLILTMLPTNAIAVPAFSSVSISFTVALASGTPPSSQSTSIPHISACTFMVALASTRLWWQAQTQSWSTDVAFSDSGITLPCASQHALLDLTPVNQAGGALLRVPASVPVTCLLTALTYACNVTMRNAGLGEAQVSLSLVCAELAGIMNTQGSTVRVLPQASSDASVSLTLASSFSTFTCSLFLALESRNACPDSQANSEFMPMAIYNETWQFNFVTNFTASPILVPTQASHLWLAHLFGHHNFSVLIFLFFLAFILPPILLVSLASFLAYYYCQCQLTASSKSTSL